MTWLTNPFADRNLVIYPAHVSNYYSQRVCKPIAFVLHEPQEPADNYESTPVYFSQPDRQASTRFYGDNDGDIFQLVPLEFPAIANGLDGKPMPRFNDGGPEFGAYSINDQTDNIEVEGLTASIAQTFSQAQYAGLKDWLKLMYIMWDVPRTPQRVLSHAQLSTQRTDGEWLRTKSGVVQEAINEVLKIEKDIKDLKTFAWTAASKNNDQDKLLWGQQVQINALKEGK